MCQSFPFINFAVTTYCQNSQAILDLHHDKHCRDGGRESQFNYKCTAEWIPSSPIAANSVSYVCNNWVERVFDFFPLRQAHRKKNEFWNLKTFFNYDFLLKYRYFLLPFLSLIKYVFQASKKIVGFVWDVIWRNHSKK